MLTATEEAELVGRSLSRVSHYRKRLDHPANGPDVMRDGRHVRVPQAAIEAFWASRRSSPGPGRSEPHRIAGVTRAQWKALEALSAGRPVGKVVGNRLAALGFVRDGALTAEGRELVRRVRG